MSESGASDDVVIVDYDHRWPTAYEQEKALICQTLGDVILDIQHVGSTAVPGLCAKPVIDILVAVARFDAVEEYSRRLSPLGYQHVSHPDDAVRLFFRKGMPRTHHLHIVEYGTEEHRRHLLFRDYLHAHGDAAREYETLKRELASKFAANRPLYTESKTDFIRSVVVLAEGEQMVAGSDPIPPTQRCGE